MTKVTFLSVLSLLICGGCLLIIYLWPTRDWMGGSLLMISIYIPILFIESILLLFFSLAEPKVRRIAVSIQVVLAIGCAVVLARYIITHQQ